MQIFYHHSKRTKISYMIRPADQFIQQQLFFNHDDDAKNIFVLKVSEDYQVKKFPVHEFLLRSFVVPT